MLTADCYARKRTDEGDKTQNAKSLHRQIERARESANVKGGVCTISMSPRPMGSAGAVLIWNDRSSDRQDAVVGGRLHGMTDPGPRSSRL
jgi:hypothetical protein